MKCSNSLALWLCLAALPAGAQAELAAMDDGSLRDVTGQSGISIELEAKMTIGEFRYTDDGSLAVSDIFIGGANRDDMFPELGFAIPNEATDWLDNVRMDIDVLDDGDAVINVLPLYGSPVDFAVRTGSWQLLPESGPADGTILADNLNLEGIFGSFRAHIDNQTGKMNIQTRFAVDDLDVDVPFLAMGIRDLRITGPDYGTAPGESENVVRVFTLADFDIYKAPNAANEDSLAVDINAFDADVHVGSVLLGGTSIGSVHLDNLSIHNTKMRVYGH
ncbi:MAG: DUF6160 family protein [Marinobacter sp.]|nr:DUF6160 family protein [Marinobacter sp.]